MSRYHHSYIGKNLFLLLTLYMNNVFAMAYTPVSTDTIIAKWPNNRGHNKVNKQNKTPFMALKKANKYLRGANNIGQSYLYGLAQSELEAYMNENKNPQIWVGWARIQQHKHKFDMARAALNHALALDPYNINAHLLMARIGIIKKDFKSAKSHCLKLFGKSDLNTASICLLEISSYQGKLAESYQRLSQMKTGQSIGAIHDNWLTLILADMAYRLKKFNESEHWLDLALDQEKTSQSLHRNITFLTEWSDIKLLLEKPKQVLSRLEALTQSEPAIEDTLILRLALAEKQMNQLENKSSSKWQKFIQQKVYLREQRKDIHHAADLAHYYLEIEPKHTKAMYWAQVNWNQAQEHKDLRLLNRAMNFQQKMTNQLNE